MGEKEHVVIEPATEADLDELSEMLGDLFAQEGDFRPDKEKQLRGLRLIFEQPSRGRVFVLRQSGAIVGMINLLFTITKPPSAVLMVNSKLIIPTIAPLCRNTKTRHLLGGSNIRRKPRSCFFLF